MGSWSRVFGGRQAPSTSRVSELGSIVVLIIKFGILPKRLPLLFELDIICICQTATCYRPTCARELYVIVSITIQNKIKES